MQSSEMLRRPHEDDEGRRVLTAEEVTAIARICWGSRFSAGTEELGRFLGINQRNANRLLSGELRANAGISAELLAELRWHLDRSPSAMCKIIRTAQELAPRPEG